MYTVVACTFSEKAIYFAHLSHGCFGPSVRSYNLFCFLTESRGDLGVRCNIIQGMREHLDKLCQNTRINMKWMNDLR